MSYEIEKGRVCYSLDFSALQDGAFPHATVYLGQYASNNVSPRTFSWELQAIDWNFQPGVHQWHEHPVMPEKIYRAAYLASCGMIKPNDRDVSGIEYLQLWENAASHPVVMNAGGHTWKPQIRIWGARVFPASEILAARDKEEIEQCLKHLPLEQSIYHEPCRECHLETNLQLYHALNVWARRDAAPFSVYITGN